MSTSKINWFEFFVFKTANIKLSLIGVCFALSAILGFFIPHFILDLSDSYDVTSRFSQALINLFLLFVAIYLNRAIYELTINSYVCGLVQNVREVCYSKWLLNYNIFNSRASKRKDYPQGEVIARIMSDTESLMELIRSGSFAIILDILFVISGLISFISINVIAGSFLTGIEIIATILLIWGSKYMRKIFHTVRYWRGMVSRIVANVMGGMKETYYCDHQNYVTKKGEKAFDTFMKKQLRANWWDAAYYSVAESMYPIFLLCVIFIFPYSKITQVAIIFAIVDLIQRTIAPIKGIASKMANIQRAISGMQRISEFVLDIESGYSSNGDKVNRNSSHTFTRLVIDIPHFAYSTQIDDKNRQANFHLRNIKFEANFGELIGVVGVSGSGKSTLLNCMTANIIPRDANFVIKGSKEDISLEGMSDSKTVIQYRSHIGLVSQDSHLFSESLIFNITMQRETPADFTEFWSRITEKIEYFNTWKIAPGDIIEPKALSLGQKQLIAAIRACYIKRPIILFDEISSALDSKLEIALKAVINLIQQNALIIIVGHRLETIISANKIWVMDQGQFVSSGTHQQLLESSKEYRNFLNELSLT
ncbi:MAG: ABC transporter ATP-binding protein [Bacteriovoracaceae bacterium]|nr:ABC transporter ATP-binding protein [Bacteriovoracaceae bacterium]